MIFDLLTPPRPRVRGQNKTDVARPILVSNSPTKFRWISSNGLGGDSITDERTEGQTGGGDCNIPFTFLKKSVGKITTWLTDFESKYFHKSWWTKCFGRHIHMLSCEAIMIFANLVGYTNPTQSTVLHHVCFVVAWSERQENRYLLYYVMITTCRLTDSRQPF